MPPRRRPSTRRAAATPSTSSSSRGCEISRRRPVPALPSCPTAIDVPSAVAASLTEELALLSEAGTLGARRRSGGRRPVRARAGRGRGGDVRGVDDGRRRRAPAARSRPPDRRAAAVPFPAPTGAARRLRDRPGRLADRCAPAVRRGARRTRCIRGDRARTTSSAPAARATSVPLRSCAKPARPLHDSRPIALHGGSVEPFGCSQGPPRRKTGSSSSSPVPTRSLRRVASPTAMRRCWRRWRSSRSGRARSARPSRRRAPGWSATWGDTNRPTRVWWGRFASCRSLLRSSPWSYGSS